MTITKTAVIFVVFQAFFYLAASFVTWDLLWVKNLGDLSFIGRFWMLTCWMSLVVLFANPK